MTDLATLMIFVDSTSVVAATTNLANLASAAATAGNAAAKMSSAVAQAAADMAKLQAQVQGAAASADSGGVSFLKFFDQVSSGLDKLKEIADFPKKIREAIESIANIRGEIKSAGETFSRLGGMFRETGAGAGKVSGELEGMSTGLRGAGAAAVKLGGGIGPIGAAIVAVTAIVIEGALAIDRYSEEMRKFEAVAEGAGRTAGLTGASLLGAAEKGGVAAGISTAAAQKIAIEYAKTGRIGSDVMAGLIGITNEYARAAGKTGAQAAKELGDAFASPGRGAADLAKKLGILDGAGVEHIQNLERQGDLLGAQSELYAALAPKLDTFANHVGGLAKVWRDVTTWASNAYTGMALSLGLGPAAQQLADRRARAVYLKNAGGMAGYSLARANQAEIDRLTPLVEATNKANEAAARNVELFELYEIVDRYTPKEVARRVMNDHRHRLQNAYDQAKPGSEEAQRLQLGLDAIDKALSDLTPKIINYGNNIHSARNETDEFIDSIRKQTQEIGLTDKELRALEVTRALNAPGVTAAQAAQIRFWADAREKAHDAAEASEKFKRAFDGIAQRLKEYREATQKNKDQTAVNQLEASLVDATPLERARAQANAQADVYIRDHPADTTTAETYRKSLVEAAESAVIARSAQDNYNGSLRFTLDILGQIHSQAQDVAAGLARAFGAPGQALGGLITSFTGLKANLEEVRLKYDAMRQSQEAASHSNNATVSENAIKRLSEINILAAGEEAAARRKAYGDMIASAKGFFKEGTTGYRVMQAAEAAYRAWQLQQFIVAQLADAAHTAKSVANSAVRGAADGAAGVAKIFSQLGMFAFPVAAAALAFMASAGVNAKGGSGGSSFDLKAVQDAQGTGTTLGDTEAKSDSIQKALDSAEKAQDLMVGYQSSMVSYLRSIDSKIGAFATVLARNITGGQLFSTDGLNLGDFDKGPSGLMKFLMPVAAIFPGLFSSKTTRTLQDQGLSFPNQTVGDILSTGAQGSTYQQVLENTKKKFFGITYSDRSRTFTESAPLGDDYLASVSLIVESLRSGVVGAAGILGLEGAEATIDAFTVALGDISLKDMSGEEIEATLNAVFGKLADDMAAFVAGDLLDQYQRIGEGQFETLIRLANGVQLVTAQFASVGLAFDRVGAAAVQASQAMIDAAGGMDAFASGMEFFRNNFLTEAERMGPVIERVTLALSDLGLAGITTIEQFKEAMFAALEGGDADRIAALFEIQGDFLDMTKYTEKLAEAQAQAASSAASAASAVSTAANAVQDLTKQLQDFYRSLVSGPLAQLSPEAAYTAARQEFERISADPAQKDKLVQVSQAFLDASKGFNASSLGYFRDLEQVKLAIEAAGGLPEGFSPTTPGSWLSNAKVTADVGALQAPLDDLRGDVVAQLRALLTQNAAIRAEERADNEALLEQVRALVRATRAS